MKSDFVLTITSTRSLEDVCQRLPGISQAHQFGVLGVHDLREKMNRKGVPFARDVRVFEVCHPRHAAQVLGQAIAISTALPCRIAVYRDGDATVLATIAPTALLRMFDAPGAATTAAEVEATMLAIMRETARAE